MIDIREAAPEDAEVIATIQAASWRDAYKDFLPAHYLNSNIKAERTQYWSNYFAKPPEGSILFIAKDGGGDSNKAVGFITLWPDGASGYDLYLDNLHILPDVKGQGIGTKLMIAAAHLVKKMQNRRVYLWVVTENWPAIRFYEKLGAYTADKGRAEITQGVELNRVRMVWDDFADLRNRTNKKS